MLFQYILLKKYKDRDNDKIHNDLKNGSHDFIKNQPNLKNVKLLEKFDEETFNKEFETNRMSDVFRDNGYGDFMKKSQNEISIDRSKLTQDNFNDYFQKLKSKKTSTQIQKYKEPEELMSMKNKDSIMMLGKQKVESYTGETGNGLKYRDLKEAYTETTLIDIENINIKDRSDNLNSIKKERSNINYNLSKKELQRRALNKKREEEDEYRRLQFIKENDKQIESHYNKLHKRLIG